MDILSETDPFVTLKIGNREFRTATLENAGCNPQWRENFIFAIEDGQTEMKLSMYDEDHTTKEFIGSLNINFMEEIKKTGNEKSDQIYVLQDGKMGRNKSSRPRVRLILEIGQSQGSIGVSSVGVLTVWLMSGADIGEHSKKAHKISDVCDPYVVTTLGTHSFRSKTCSRNKDPVWGEKMRFIIDPSLAGGVLRFSVYDSDLLSKDDFLCSCEQDLDGLVAHIKSANSALGGGDASTSSAATAAGKYAELAQSLELVTNAEGGRRKNGTLSFKASFEDYTDHAQARRTRPRESR
jgi:Ca2+-dependent lipid-binding protein